MQPTKKDEAIEELIKNTLGHDRRNVIASNVCVPPPIGCGGLAIEFKDSLSRKEYSVSGLCQKCQDNIFGGGEK